jgi:hypothetical protein
MTFATQHEMRLSYGFGLKGTRWWAEYLEPIPDWFSPGCPKPGGSRDNWLSLFTLSESNTDLVCRPAEFQSLPFCSSAGIRNLAGVCFLVKVPTP